MTPTALLDLMRADLGLAEIPGPRANPEIMRRAAVVAGSHPKLLWIRDWYRDDDTPWCGLQMAYVVVIAGLLPPRPNPLAALEWRNWGVVAPFAAHGSVAVLERAGGGHVGVVEAVSANNRLVKLIGGNQGNRVASAWFDASRVVAWRRPNGVLLAAAPIERPTGALSTNEA